MSGHTPGPWRVEEYGRYVVVRGCDGRIVHEIRIKAPDAPANARLIAASPELLAALIRIVDAMDARDGDEIVPGVDAARQAIAKATGGEM